MKKVSFGVNLRMPAGGCQPGKGKKAVKEFLKVRGGKPGRIKEVVCDMPPALLVAIDKEFSNAAVTVDGFHVARLFTQYLNHLICLIAATLVDIFGST